MSFLSFGKSLKTGFIVSGILSYAKYYYVCRFLFQFLYPYWQKEGIKWWGCQSFLPSVTHGDPSLTCYCSNTTEYNCMKLSQNLYDMFPSCTSYFRFWSESICGPHLANHEFCHLWTWDMGRTISYPLLLYHWIELNETFTETLLHVPIVDLFQILIQIKMEVKRCMLSNGGVGVSS